MKPIFYVSLVGLVALLLTFSASQTATTESGSFYLIGGNVVEEKTSLVVGLEPDIDHETFTLHQSIAGSEFKPFNTHIRTYPSNDDQKRFVAAVDPKDFGPPYPTPVTFKIEYQKGNEQVTKSLQATMKTPLRGPQEPTADQGGWVGKTCTCESIEFTTDTRNYNSDNPQDILGAVPPEGEKLDKENPRIQRGFGWIIKTKIIEIDPERWGSGCPEVQKKQGTASYNSGEVEDAPKKTSLDNKPVSFVPRLPTGLPHPDSFPYGGLKFSNDNYESRQKGLKAKFKSGLIRTSDTPSYFFNLKTHPGDEKYFQRMMRFHMEVKGGSNGGTACEPKCAEVIQEVKDGIVTKNSVKEIDCPTGS